ncbi:hypothetical protein LCGC14_1488430 [marine sediment metagenome]|uniref:Uncharacterized protein n=1 Tax=marine sediment metagenome TaxID=412755 RepID=A0A0F9JTB5_9ZZZZ
MIIKILRAGNKGDLTQRWAIFSDVLNAYYVTVTGEKFSSIIEGGHEDYLFDYTAFNGDCMKLKKVTTVEVTRRNGTNLNIAFNTVGYLLNDEGKTIEKIN